jgi:hypothetical protein
VRPVNPSRPRTFAASQVRHLAVAVHALSCAEPPHVAVHAQLLDSHRPSDEEATACDRHLLNRERFGLGRSWERPYTTTAQDDEAG